MKTILYSILVLLLFSGSFAIAQNTNKLSFAVLGGVNFQNLNGKDFNGNKLTNDMILGYHAGINVQIPFAPEFYLQPGLNFSTKGANNTYSLLGTSYTTSTNIYYVEVPLNLVYKAKLSNGYFMLGFGPYAGYGVGGTVKTKGGSADIKTDVKFQNVVEIGDDPTVSYFKALDAGANVFAGYEMASGLFIQLETQLGLININPEYKIVIDDKSILKNTGFGLSLGYRF